MRLPDKPVIPCFLCGKPIRVKLTKNDKPYFICEPCGLQVFVRCKPGIRILKRLLKTIADDGGKFLNLNQSSFQTLCLVSRLDELNRKLDQVKQDKSLTDYFLSGTESELAEKALEKEIRAVRNALKGGQEK